MKKYVQTRFERVSTEKYRSLSLKELRIEAKRLYDTLWRYKTIVNIHTGMPVQFYPFGGKKTSHGEAIYSKKVALIEVLGSLVKYAKYNNWGKAKPSDGKNVIGYYNFKAYVFIDGEKECIRLAVQAWKDGSFYYNVEANKMTRK